MTMRKRDLQERFTLEALEPRLLLAVTTIFSDDFNTTFTPNWTTNMSQNRQWKLNNYQPKEHDHTQTAYSSGMGDPDTASADHISTWLEANYMSHTVDLTGYDTVTLTFWYNMAVNQYNGNYVLNEDVSSVWVNGVQKWVQTTTSQGWKKATIDLTAFAGQPNVTIEFDYVSYDYAYYWYYPQGQQAQDSGCWIDDVLVTGDKGSLSGPMPFLNHPLQNITHASQAETMSVWFYSDKGVDWTTVQDNNTVFSCVGPNGITTAVTYNTMAPATGATRQTTYDIAPPNGTAWAVADNGLYTVTAISDTVVDAAGHKLKGGIMGTFMVAVPGPNDPPVTAVTTPADPTGGNVAISYTLTDATSDKARVAVQYSSDGGTTWHNATKGVGGDGLSNLVTSPTGVTHTFMWNSKANLGLTPSDACEIRIVASDARGTGAADTTANFTVDNRPTVTLPTPDGPKANNAVINYFLSDFTSALASVVVQYSADGGTTWHNATKGPGGDNLAGLKTSPAGTHHTFVWNTLTDLGAVDNANVKLRITPRMGSGFAVPATTASFEVDNLHVDPAPTVATPAAANHNPVTTTTVTLTALGADDRGEGHLTYTWATVGTVPAPVLYDINNGTHAGSTETVTFGKAGTYNFRVTIADTQGLTATSNVTVVVQRTVTNIVVTPWLATLWSATTKQMKARAVDQFGVFFTTQPAFVWSVVAGGVGGSINAVTGLYTAPYTGTGTDTVMASFGAASGTTVLHISV